MGSKRLSLPTAPPSKNTRNHRWEARWRWGLIEQARQLALGLGLDEPPQVVPYLTGFSLGDGSEQVWAETWARCSLEESGPVAERWPISCWAITSRCLTGRLSSGRRPSWSWRRLVAYQVDLKHEQVELHINDGMVRFLGPGAAAIAVAAVWWLHGSVGLLEHPGLAPIRARRRR
jgi:hypothetical protein